MELYLHHPYTIIVSICVTLPLLVATSKKMPNYSHPPNPTLRRPSVITYGITSTVWRIEAIKGGMNCFVLGVLSLCLPFSRLFRIDNFMLMTIRYLFLPSPTVSQIRAVIRNMNTAKQILNNIFYKNMKDVSVVHARKQVWSKVTLVLEHDLITYVIKSEVNDVETSSKLDSPMQELSNRPSWRTRHVLICG